MKQANLLLEFQNQPNSFFFQMEEAKKCVAELDVDEDGRVSYPEFLLVWKYKN